MMRKSYGDIVEKIVENSDLSREEVEEKIRGKIKQLSNLVSKEGAAHIIANQLGVKVFDEISKKGFKIKDLIGGMNAVTLNVKVMNIYEIRSFKRKDTDARVVSLFIADDTGACRLVIWDEGCISKIEKDEIKEGDVLGLKNVYSKENNGFVELHFGGKAVVDVNPSGVFVEVGGSKRVFSRKKIVELNVGDNVEMFGTVVQVFEPRYFIACPECRRKVDLDGEKSVCKNHGDVVGEKVPVMNMFFDDGGGSIRVVAFRDQVKSLVSEEVDYILDAGNFEDIKDNLSGSQLLFSGRVTKNEMFDRLEFIINSVSSVDPLEMVKEIDV